MFLDHKGYHLNDVIYMRIIVGELAVYKTTEILIVKYHAENPKNNMSFSLWFLSDNVSGLLYLAIINVYPAFIIEFALRLKTMSN